MAGSQARQRQAWFHLLAVALTLVATLAATLTAAPAAHAAHAAPSAPVQLSPADGASLPQPVGLSWSAVPGTQTEPIIGYKLADRDRVDVRLGHREGRYVAHP